MQRNARQPNHSNFEVAKRIQPKMARAHNECSERTAFVSPKTGAANTEFVLNTNSACCFDKDIIVAVGSRAC